MFFLHSSGCRRPCGRRVAAVASAVGVAAGTLVSFVLQHGWTLEEPGVDTTWRIISLVVCGLVIVVGLGVLLFWWRRNQEEP